MGAEPEPLTCGTVDEKLARLQGLLRSMRRVVVAFSAGVDSTFLLKVAIDTLGPENVLAVTARSDSLARQEFEQATKLAESMGAAHRIIDTEEFDDPNYRANPTNRCYYCKTELYTKLRPIMEAEGYAAVVNGTNADDLGDYRPGLQAADEQAVRAPCAEAGMTKADIRELSERMGLPTFDKPASPCLSSRIQYGEEITAEKLRMIEAGEAFLRENGFRVCRVRHHSNLARIEVPADQIARLMEPELRDRLDAEFRRIGYQYVTIDLRGFRSGSMNEVIAFGKKQPEL
jgi:uncharacterized protein